MKKFAAVLLALMLLVTAALAEGKLEGEGFDTAEEAVKAYVQYFNEGNAEGMLSTFAIESYVDHIDAAAYIGRIKAVNVMISQAIPVSNDYIRGILIAKRYGDVADGLYSQYLNRNLPEEYHDLAEGMMIALTDDESIAAFTGALDSVPMTGWFGEIKLMEILDPYAVSDMYGSEQMQKRIREMEKALGCDALEEAPVLIRIDGVDYLLCMQCACYEGRWYNITTKGDLASLLGLPYYMGGFAQYDEIDVLN